MGGVIPKFQHGGPVTYTVVENVVGGQLVEARTGGVGVAAAGSLKVLGVATRDARPVDVNGTTTSALGHITTYVDSGINQFVAVGGNGEHWPVTFSTAAAFGDLLVATATGRVGVAGAAPDARTIVGRCVEPAGVAAGAVGLAKLFG